MGFSKTHHRDETSGLHVHDDISSGTHGVEDLAARNAARQESINKAITSDWPLNMTSADDANIDHPAYGNASQRFPVPSDFIVGSKAARFGSSAEDDTDTKGGAPQKPSKQKGIEPARNRG